MYCILLRKAQNICLRHAQTLNWFKQPPPPHPSYSSLRTGCSKGVLLLQFLCACASVPSGHTTLKQRWFNVKTFNQRWIDVVSTLCACWVVSYAAFVFSLLVPPHLSFVWYLRRAMIMAFPWYLYLYLWSDCLVDEPHEIPSLFSLKKVICCNFV